ncbi:MAG: HIT family protein [bacterium]|nr:HIT family protein [bacterium]
MNRCIFCDIINRESPAEIIYEDEFSIAFMDINPVTPGHLLIVPKKHFRVFTDMDEVSAGELFSAALKVSRAVRRSELKPEGLNLFLAEESAGMQEIFHCHLHIIPRYSGDGFGLKIKYSDETKNQLKINAEKIRKIL